MSGRGEWWDVKLSSDGPMVVGILYVNRPARFDGMHIDDVLVILAHEGDEEAIAAVLECEGDLSFQAAVRRYAAEKT